MGSNRKAQFALHGGAACKRGITVDFEQHLAEATFAGNAMVSYNGATPYHAHFGRQPGMLPDMTMLPEATATGTARDLQRVREIALQKIIESTAIARIRRSSRSMTTPPGEVLDYKEGELVDFWRQPRSKDTQAWHGPAKVLRSEPSRGQVNVHWRGDEVRVKFGDARRFLDFSGAVFGSLDDNRMPHSNTWHIVQQHVESMQPKHYSTLALPSEMDKDIYS